MSTIQVRKMSKKKNNSTDINLLVNPESKSEYFIWDKSKIVSALREETQLAKKMAIEIANAVEDRVINSKLTTISSSLIRELVDNELFDRGLQNALKSQQIIGLPKHDINELIFNKSQENSNIKHNNPETVAHTISETILKQYALQEVFTPGTAEAHRNGVIHIHDLGYICRVYAFHADTQLSVKINDICHTMTLKELYNHVKNKQIQINDTQYIKNVDDIFVLDRNRWIKLKRVIFSDETKDMVEFTVNGKLFSVTADHGCVVKRDNQIIIVRADEVKCTDEFIYSVNNNISNL